MIQFRYGEGQQIFEDFNLSFMPGERVGLVGHSGGGKSTLFALLQRFYDVQSRPHPDRRAGHRPRDAREPARRDRRGAAGHLAVSPLGHGKYPLRPAGRHRRGGVRSGDRARAATSSRACRTACARSSASAASSFPAASASASPSRAPSSRTRRSCCSTRRPRRSTASPRRRSAKRSAA